MDVILTEDVKNLGLKGELHEVADGYARNFLLPEQKAVHTNERNQERFQKEQEKIEQRRQKMVEEAEELGDDLSKIDLTLEKSASEEGTLYGSVTQQDILDELDEEGFDSLTQENVVINEAVREVGDYTVTINLAGSVQTEVEVEIVAS